MKTNLYICFLDINLPIHTNNTQPTTSNTNPYYKGDIGILWILYNSLFNDL